MDDQIIGNAANAAQTPANGPPPVDDDAPSWTPSAAEEGRDRARMEAYLQSEKFGTPARQQAPSAVEAQIKKLSQLDNQFGIHSSDPKVQQAAMQVMRKLIATQEAADPEFQEQRAQMTLAERREEFGVEEPRLPKPWLEEYKAEYEGWEAPLFDVAREHGLVGRQVRELRDAALELGRAVGDSGRPASEDDLKRVFDKHSVPASARAALTRLWRQVEGGGA